MNVTFSRFKWLLLLAATSILGSNWCYAKEQAPSQEPTSKTFGEYTVHFSTFNSLFVPAEIAAIHDLVRAKNQALINIAVQKTATGETVPAEVTGSAKNLMQQTKAVVFKTIAEPDAVYYIGAVRHSDQEVFHFDINIVPDGSATPIDLRLTRKLYTER